MKTAAFGEGKHRAATTCNQEMRDDDHGGTSYTGIKFHKLKMSQEDHTA